MAGALEVGAAAAAAVVVGAAIVDGGEVPGAAVVITGAELVWGMGPDAAGGRVGALTTAGELGWKSVPQTTPPTITMIASTVITCQMGSLGRIFQNQARPADCRASCSFNFTNKLAFRAVLNCGRGLTLKATIF